MGMAEHERPVRGDTDVWLTPPWLLERLGPFDLDPCACDEPRPWPTARRHFVKADDGLLQPWHGRVWLNPPYGPQTGDWLSRLAAHGDGIALVFARTDTAWFHDVAVRAPLILFLRGRLAFYAPDGTEGKWTGGAPSCLIAYGDENARRLRSSGLDGFFSTPDPREVQPLRTSLFA